MLRYHERITDCGILGPYRRAVLWTHGCCFNCEGCIADEYRNGSFRECTAGQMAEWFLENAVHEEGITISGGEPFLQAEDLAKTIRMIRRERDLGVIVYTGFLYEQLLEKQEREKGVRALLDQTDLLIDGPYVRALDRGAALPARGSENQRILPLTERYREEIDTYYYGCGKRKIEIRVEADRTIMVGVPSQEQARLWKTLKESRLSTGGESV